MIHNANNYNALVPYSKSTAEFSLMCEKLTENLIFTNKCTKRKQVYLFYKSRCRTYTFFLSLFFLLSSFAYCLYGSNTLLINEKVFNIVNSFKQHGFTYEFVFTFFGYGLCYRLLSFFSGFTVFSFSTTFICSLRLFFAESLMFAALFCDIVSNGAVFTYSFVLLFSLQLFFDVLFFTEVCKYGSDASRISPRRKLYICVLLLVLYIAFYLLLTYLQLYLYLVSNS